MRLNKRFVFRVSEMPLLWDFNVLPQPTMQRHRMVYAALAEEFAQGLHALSLQTKTEVEAQRSPT